MGGGSDSSGSQQVKVGPADYLKPYVQGAAADAQALYKTGGPNVYPGSTVAAQSPETLRAYGMGAARAVNGSPTVGAANTWSQGILNGTSPTYGQLGDSVWSQVRPRVDSVFSGAGRYGSNAYTEALSRGYTEGIAPSFASLQGQAAGLAPTLANQDWQDIQGLAGIGAARDQYGQQNMADAVARFNAQQQRPYDNLNQYMSLLYGNPYKNQSSTGTQPSQGFNWQGLLGGALGTAAAFV